ncbi:MAG TPA: alpha/beta hydrolase [Candidatus Angelobacter sp.]|nr:alpha/beta hydrolase [Candidatus Angelobacter sp.]
MMKSLPLILLSVTACTVAWAQAGENASGDFKITQTYPVVSTSTISGKEGYQLSTTPQGFTVTSHLWVAEGELPVFSQVEETLGPDWSLQRYTFNGVVGGINQKIEAWVDGDKIQMQMTSERMNPLRAVDLRPNTVVLDNFVPTHFQVLLNQFTSATAKSPGMDSEEVYLVVPQKLLALKGTLSRSGTDTGILNGKEIEVKKYVLKMPASIAQIWTDDQNLVLGVYFDTPDIEYLRAGFDLPQLNLAMKKTLPSEVPVSFPSHGRQLLGTLMLPPESLGKKEKYAMVVMVGGFGPVDRDETVGRNKPMRDVAVGLARKGIATLRYDKPTYSIRGKLDLIHLTIEEEAIDGAVAAIHCALTLPQIDAANIFLLGHSEGGEMAPFILQQATEIRGAVLMATPGRSPDQFIPDQLATQLKMKDTAQPEMDAQVAALKSEFAAIRNGTLPNSVMVLGLPASYWRSLMARDVIPALHNVKVPLLVLQGDRDAQVSRQDYELVIAAVPTNRLDAEYFTGLDHIFIPAPEGANGSEMVIGSRVADQVINRITAWLEKHEGGNSKDELARRAGQRQ